MTREEFISQEIKNRGHNPKSFSAVIGMPYTTLRSILSNGIGGASIDNVLKICKGLHVSIADLQSFSVDCAPFSVNPHEKEVITAYRNNPQHQYSVDSLLGVRPTVEASYSSPHEIKATLDLVVDEVLPNMQPKPQKQK